MIASLGLVACSRLSARTTISPATPAGPALVVPSVPTPSVPPSLTPNPEPSPVLTSTPSLTALQPTPTICALETGSLDHAQIESAVLTSPLAYQVYTPPCYQAFPQQRYPVVYLLHGYGFSENQWVRLGVVELADRLISQGEIQPIIIVLPQESDQLGQPPQEQFGQPTRNYFGDALVRELVPAVDASFRTIPQRQSRAIGGVSRGGNWAFHLGLTHWSLFGLVAGHSASLFMVDTNATVEDWLANIPPDQFPTFFIDSGRGDLGFDNILNFETILDTKNVPHELHIYPGSHNEDYWITHLEQYLRWYASNLSAPR